ncbi:MAG TPA: AAA-like domain-containing protein, partial [Trichocoleus sp.]
QWYAGLAYMLASNFELLTPVAFHTWWREREFLAPVQRLSKFIDRVLLPKVSRSIIVFLDEIDSVLSLPFEMNDFFVLLRTFYNKRADSPVYRRLNFVLLGVATPSSLIGDKTRTPFNIGLAIQLQGFQLHETQPLMQGLADKTSNPQAVLQEVLNWTGGQPFLTQKVCKLIRSCPDLIPLNAEATWVENLIKTQVLDNWEAQDEPEHLRTIRDRILSSPQQTPQLLQLCQQILQQEIIASDSPIQNELLLSGLVVKRVSPKQPSLSVLSYSNRIYRAVFDESWIEQELARC